MCQVLQREQGLSTEVSQGENEKRNRGRSWQAQITDAKTERTRNGMIKSLTVAFLTARREPYLRWFLESLDRETGKDYSNTKVMVISTYPIESPLDVDSVYGRKELTIHRPKPTIWAGEHRITKVDWWSKCNSANTAIALCETEWLAMVDDRSVLSHGWLHCIQDSMIQNYAVCGSYEKHANMKVENGEVVDEGEFLGADVRRKFGTAVRTSDWYGGSCALPLEWCLRVNGFSEHYCDGLGFEDIQFGITLRNNHLDMRYDSRMRIIEDRTPSEAYQGALKRASKPSPDPNNKYLAKDYRILEIMGSSTTSGNCYDISKLRQKVLRGEPFDLPCESGFDWFDGEFVGDMT
jgi:hypothetical protein